MNNRYGEKILTYDEKINFLKFICHCEEPFVRVQSFKRKGRVFEIVFYNDDSYQEQIYEIPTTLFMVKLNQCLSAILINYKTYQTSSEFIGEFQRQEYKILLERLKEIMVEYGLVNSNHFVDYQLFKGTALMEFKHATGNVYLQLPQSELRVTTNFLYDTENLNKVLHKK